MDAADPPAGGQLLVNNSFAGSHISCAGNYAACLPGRIRSLATEAAAPDLVLVCTGLNDVAHRVDLGAFRRDCREMVQKLAAQYPAAQIWVGTITVGKPSQGPWYLDPATLEDRAAYNDVLRQCVAEAGPFRPPGGPHPHRRGATRPSTAPTPTGRAWSPLPTWLVPGHGRDGAHKRLRTARGESPQGFPRSSETRWTNGQPARDLVPAGCFGEKDAKTVHLPCVSG